MTKVQDRAWESFKRRLKTLNDIVDLGPDMAFLAANQMHMLREAFSLFAPDEYFEALRAREQHSLRARAGFCCAPDCDNENQREDPYCTACEEKDKEEIAQLDLAEALSGSTRARS